MIIAIPTGIKVFSLDCNSLGWSNSLTTPLLFAVGLYFYLLWRCYWRMLANAGIDIALHDTIM
jgi:heme/copper-type cytochrome/quinol oxidase subunit 1